MAHSGMDGSRATSDLSKEGGPKSKSKLKYRQRGIFLLLLDQTYNKAAEKVAHSDTQLLGPTILVSNPLCYQPTKSG